MAQFCLCVERFLTQMSNVKFAQSFTLQSGFRRTEILFPPLFGWGGRKNVIWLLLLAVILQGLERETDAEFKKSAVSLLEKFFEANMDFLSTLISVLVWTDHGGNVVKTLHF